jgi:hypothetical protein
MGIAENWNGKNVSEELAWHFFSVEIMPVIDAKEEGSMCLWNVGRCTMNTGSRSLVLIS